MIDVDTKLLNVVLTFLIVVLNVGEKRNKSVTQCTVTVLTMAIIGGCIVPIGV